MSRPRMSRIAACLFAMLFAAGAQAASCNAPPPVGTGDDPARITHSLDGLLGLAAFCAAELGQTLRWTDADGTHRRACLLTPPGFDKSRPLPLLIWLHPSLFPQDSVILTGYLLRMGFADLTGDPARRGFQMLLVEGRDTTHYYPFPDNTGLGWDNWHRNFNRSSPALNVDVATIDHFLAETRALGGVDAKRIYTGGWSNGAAMAQIYALNTPGIAAAAVYSSPDPFSDVLDPCAQAPFASNPKAALMDIHNACDIIGICSSGMKFHQQLASRYPGLKQKTVIINALRQEVSSCVASCASPSQLLTLGTIDHLRWPLVWNDAMFQFLREHPLP